MILQRNGQLLTFPATDDPATADVAFDLAEHVSQLEGESLAAARDFTLDPDFENNGYLYVVWSLRPHLVEGGTRVSRFTMTEDDPPKLRSESRLDLITYPSGDHIGSCLRFGPDGMLYICTGDGALPFPPDRYLTAQDLSDVRGSVLRIDVNEATVESPYRIPADNPFVDRSGARGEIFAFGIRNGFRAAFHPQRGELWVADVGWERCELIHRIQRGGNHGWSLFEGPYPVNPDQKPGPGKPILPAIVLERDEAQSVTGGVFVPKSSVLASKNAALADRYLFGCFMNGRIWTADVSDPDQPIVEVAADSGLRLIDFKATTMECSPAGKSELLAVDFGEGGIYRLVPSRSDDSHEAFPRRLSETGLFADLETLRPHQGVAAYRPAATMYRGGATTQRLIAIPGDEPVGRNFPTGTALANTLSRTVIDADGREAVRKVETQVLLFDGLNWDPYTYRWNDDQSDAKLVAAGGARMSLTVPDPMVGRRAIEHVFASRSQCNTCHHVFNQGPLTFGPEQLYAAAEDVDSPWVFSDWQQLVQAGFVRPRPSDPDKRLVDPYDTTQDLERRARSYLDINCSACHRPAGGATSGLHLQHHVPLDKTAAVDEQPSQGAFGIGDACLIRPGDPAASVLMYRIATSGPGRMPKLGGHEPDLAGGRLIWQWIESLAGPDQSDSRRFVSVDSIPQTTDRALRLWRDLSGADAQAATEGARKVIDGSGDAAITGLFYRWLPDSERKQLVGENPDVSEILAKVGDAERGRRWFAESSASQCRNCHHVEGTEGLIGPSLAGIAKRRTRAELLDHMLNPSKEILPEWRTYSVLTSDGEVISGLRNSESDQQWVLKSADGKQHRIAVEDIESSRVNPLSMMPTGQLAPMTPQEVADLLEYLLTLDR